MKKGSWRWAWKFRISKGVIGVTRLPWIPANARSTTWDYWFSKMSKSWLPGVADNHKMLALNQLSLFSLVTSYLFFAEPENKSLPDSSDLVNPCCHSLCHHYPQSGDGWVPIYTFLILWHRWLQQKHTAAGLHRFPRLCSSFSFCPSSDFSLSSDLPSLSSFGGSVLGSVNWQQQQIQNLQHSALGHMG